MGRFLSKTIIPQSSVDDHGIIGIRKEGSSVDAPSIDEENLKSSVFSLLEWCRDSRPDSHALLQRNWIDIPQEGKDIICNSTTITHEAQRFRIMQWNILADALGSSKDNFIKCPKEALQWDRRKRHILEGILTYLPDVVCCQEVDHFDDFLRPKMKKAGYDGAFLPKPWSPCLDVNPNNGPDGCAIFYKSHKFELIEYKAVSLKTLGMWRNHGALFLLLKFREQNAFSNSDKSHMSHEMKPGMFLVGSTHLKAKIGCENIRTTQAKDLLSNLVPYAARGIPIIITGDLNATPEEEVYRLFRKNEKPCFESAYSCMNERNKECPDRREPPYTTWCIRSHGETPRTLDYVWFSKTDFRLKRILNIPTADEITANRLPSCNYPSDHVSLVCDMDLLSSPHNNENSNKAVPKI